MTRGARAAALALVVAVTATLAPPGAGAQERPPEELPFSMDQIAEAVAADLNSSVLFRARSSCISFVVDATAERRLRAAGAESDFTEALRDVCFRGTSLQVTTEPAGAEVWVQGRRVGTSPWTSPMPLARNLPVEVRLDGRYRRVTANMVRDSLVTIHFALQRDTLPLPVGLSEVELQALRGQARGFDARARPVAPQPPSPGGSARSVIVGGLVGAAAGIAVGSVACRSTVDVFITDTIGDIIFERANGTRQETNGGCVGFSIGGGTLAGGLAGNVWSGLTAGRRRRVYEQELRVHERALARWEEQRRAVEQLRREEERRAERARLAARNAEIAAANRSVSAPRITVEGPARMPRAVMIDAATR